MNGRVPPSWQKQAYKGESPEAISSLSHDLDAGPDMVDASLQDGDATSVENI